MTRTLHRFELADLLVTLCEAGQAPLAARIARALLMPGFVCAAPRPPGSWASAGGSTGSRCSTSGGASARGQLRDPGQRIGEDLGVARDELKSPRPIEALEHDLETARRGR
jgi:hypothetical protein